MSQRAEVRDSLTSMPAIHDLIRDVRVFLVEVRIDHGPKCGNYRKFGLFCHVFASKHVAIKHVLNRPIPVHRPVKSVKIVRSPSGMKNRLQ